MGSVSNSGVLNGCAPILLFALNRTISQSLPPGRIDPKMLVFSTGALSGLASPFNLPCMISIIGDEI